MSTKTEPIWEIERDAEGLPVRMWWRGVIPMTRTWREKAAPLIHKVIAETKSTELHLLKSRLRDAYPWGERKYYPYKIWCDEVNRQLGLKHLKKRKSSLPEPVPPEQGRLFN